MKYGYTITRKTSSREYTHLTITFLAIEKGYKYLNINPLFSISWQGKNAFEYWYGGSVGLEYKATQEPRYISIAMRLMGRILNKENYEIPSPQAILDRLSRNIKRYVLDERESQDFVLLEDVKDLRLIAYRDNQDYTPYDYCQAWVMAYDETDAKEKLYKAIAQKSPKNHEQWVNAGKPICQVYNVHTPSELDIADIKTLLNP